MMLRAAAASARTPDPMVQAASTSTLQAADSSVGTGAGTAGGHGGGERAGPAAVPTLTPAEQMLSSGVGAVLTSLVVTPFDVVKTRMQVAALDRGCQQCGDVFILRNGIMEHLCTYKGPPILAPAHYTSTYGALVGIGRNEGPAALWRGLPPTLLMAIPLTVMYFTAYDQLSDRFGRDQASTPLLAGSISRTASVTVISPIEMLRTKMQAATTGGYADLKPAIQNAVRNEGVGSLWRGLGATLMRDVPFSAIYWTGYEQLMTAYRLHDPPTARRNLGETGPPAVPPAVAFASGAISGSVAATLTLPFDVVKTHQQAALGRAVAGGTAPPLSATAVAREIVQTQGWRGLAIGLTPRVAKVAPSCAIMISSYEYCKDFFRGRRLDR